MFRKYLSKISHPLLAAAVMAIAATPALAEDAFLNRSAEALNASIENGPVLLSQARGHETYDGGEQIPWPSNPEEFGHVAGKAGHVISVKRYDGSFVNIPLEKLGSFVECASGFPGADVLIEPTDDGGYTVVGLAQPHWITVLANDYGYKKEVYIDPLESRTAPIWAQLDANMNRPAPEPAVTPAPAPAPVPEPVPGLW